MRLVDAWKRTFRLHCEADVPKLKLSFKHEVKLKHAKNNEGIANDDEAWEASLQAWNPNTDTNIEASTASANN